jgi:phosphoglucosamine mutase
MLATRTSGRAIQPSSGRSATPESRLGGNGRVLVRPSGTEPALRVMVEGPDAALVAELADAIASLAGERLN